MRRSSKLGRCTGAALVAALSAFALSPAIAAAGPSPVTQGVTAGTVVDRLLVKFRPAVTPAAAIRLLSDHDAEPERAIPEIGVRVVRVAAAARARVQAALARHPTVEFAEVDGLARPQETVPDDPFFPQGSYALSGGAWGWYRTHTTQAWDVTRGDPSVIVAILDTGLRAQAKDFGGQVVGGWNVLTQSSDVTSGAGNHGAHVAGVAGLAINTASGNAGYCPGCKLMPVQVGTDSGASYSDMAAGITWAADHGARVINLSWAGTTASATLASAVSYARSRGAVVFAAAGNSNCDCPTYPAATPGVIGVGGVGNTGAKAGDSNFGTWVAVAAPEGNMTSWPTLNGAAGFGPVGGTSLAAPAAAGIAGLLFSANPTLNAPQVENALLNTAAPTGFPLRHGAVDAMAALQSLGISGPPQSGAPVNSVPPQILLSLNAESDTAPLTAAPQVGQVLVRGQGAWKGPSPLSLSAVRWNRCSPAGTSCTLAGSSSSYTVKSTDAGYAFKLAITFTGPAGSTTATTSLTAAVGGTTAPAAPPANTSPPVISGTARAGEALAATAGTWSGSPTSYAYQWSRCDATGAGCSTIAGATTAQFAVGAADVGSTLRVAVTASNAGGPDSAISARTAVVQSAPAPPPTSPVSQTFSGSLSAKATSRTFAVSVGSGVATARLSFTKCSSLSLGLQQASATLGSARGPSVLTLERTLAAGSYSYVVSGSDRCSFTLAVTAPTP